MYIRHSIYKFQVIFSLFMLSVFFGFYFNYKSAYLSDLEKYIEREVVFNKNQIMASLNLAALQYGNRREKFLDIHHSALKVLRSNKSINLKDLKKRLKSEYRLNGVELELFLIDKNYVIYDTTFKKDLGFNLSIITEAKQYLDKTKADGKVYLADNVSEDALDGKYKIYSYSKLRDDTYLELGFIDINLFNNIWDNLNKEKNLILYKVISSGNFQYYYEMKKRKGLLTKEKHFKNLEKFPKEDKTDNIIITTARNKRVTKIENDKSIIIYKPLLEYEKFKLLEYTDIIMRLEIDISHKVESLKNFKHTFFISLIFVVGFLIFLFKWIKRNFTVPIEQIAKSIKNEKTIDCFVGSNNGSELVFISNEYNNIFLKLKKEIKKNKELSYLDSLTKTNNRKFYNEKIHELLSLNKRYKTPFCMILLDVDDFKKINDLYGHSVGDKVLIYLAQLTKNIIRESDILCRVGGEEFVILLTQTSIGNAKKVAEKIRMNIENNLNVIENKKITISLGLTECLNDDNADSIFKRADKLLYTSKTNGKNRVTFDNTFAKNGIKDSGCLTC